MKSNDRRSRFWRAGATLVAVGLATSCSVYHPLDQGSAVPWAQAHQGVGRTVSADGGPPGATYVVRRGDRLAGLADRYGLSVPQLARANNLQPPYVIRVGQVLRVPTYAPGAGPDAIMVAQSGRRPIAVASVGGLPASPNSLPSKVTAGRGTNASRQVAALDITELPLPASESAPPPVAAGPRASKPAQPALPAGQRYTVRSGETLSEIARRLDVGGTELAQANGVREPYRLYAGQQLRVPHHNPPGTTTVTLGEDQPRTVRLATGAPPPLKGDDFLWPVNGKVVGRYGPIDRWRRRDGIDIAARRGAPVLAAQDGIVAYAGDGIPGYGQMILLRHDQGYITTYAHNATLLVEVGDMVQRGQVIARVGDSGDAAQTMLYFELRKGRKPIDPQTRLVHDSTTLASTE
jgi:murein DD-endopeptidase MepM/ murein hydrolase activator NlpD